MKLEDHIRWCIYNYPALYRCNDYVSSRIRVLDHLFFGIGTGYEWSKKGFLAQMNMYSPKGRLIHKHVISEKDFSNNYFDMNLYRLEFDAEFEDAVINELKDRFHYITHKPNSKNSIFYASDGIVIFESDDVEYVKDVIAKYDADKWNRDPNNREFINVRNLRNERICNPYPLCQYAALVEISNGQTNSRHQENFNFKPKADWLKGCVDIAEYAWNYYHDENCYKHNMYHPDFTIKLFRNELIIAEKQGEKPVYEKNMQKGETIEDFANRTWNSHRTEQIEILRKFLVKFSPEVLKVKLPTYNELLLLAKQNPPPQEWYDE